MKKRVLLIGAGEQLGELAIEPLLEAGFEVFAVTISAKEKRNKVKWIQTDLLRFENIEPVFKDVKPNYLLHLDWTREPKNSLAHDVNFYWFQASLEMLKYFSFYGGERAVYAGTCFEYEFGDELLNEFTTKINPTSIYARYKNYANEITTLYANQKNISFGWGRIFYMYGEHELERRFGPRVISSLNHDEEVVIPVTDFIRDYLFPCDVAGAFVKFLDTDVTGCVNICSKTPIKIRDLMGSIGEKLNKRHLLKFEEKVSDEPDIILGDNTRLTEEVGYIPKRSLDEELNKLLMDHNLMVS